MGSASINVGGHCVHRFAAVRDEFERNFGERGEIGASVCVIHEGQVVVDLWGECADPQTAAPWRAETLVVVHSATKGAVALCANVLADAGDLDLDEAVARHWPRFASAGKREITVRQLLNHQAGVAGVSRPLTLDDIHDFDAM